VKEARFWEAADGRVVNCRLCHQHCAISPGRRGLCGVRENRDGRLFSLVYGHPAAINLDPIEKKPLYHFLPGSLAFSLGTCGCNFHCQHCQNCEISQARGRAMAFLGQPGLPPGEVVDRAQASGAASIAYTYTEPTVFLEYAADIAQLAQERGLRNIFVTNGYITPEALRPIAPLIAAANLDLKFFREDRYREVCGARLQPVLDTIRLYRELGVWIEITTLVIPGHNDDDEQLGQIAEFIAGLDRDIPWHLSAFHPAHRMPEVAPTPPVALARARAIGHAAGLRFVYLGNLGMSADTLCPGCGSTLVERRGMTAIANHLDHDRCPQCHRAIPGVWS
jgi:pyruvate formate lyase activating enzyme